MIKFVLYDSQWYMKILLFKLFQLADSIDRRYENILLDTKANSNVNMLLVFIENKQTIFSNRRFCRVILGFLFVKKIISNHDLLINHVRKQKNIHSNVLWHLDIDKTIFAILKSSIYDYQEEISLYPSSFHGSISLRRMSNFRPILEVP